MEILWSTRALRQLRKVEPDEDRRRILRAVEELVNFPDCGDVRKLKGKDFYRLRVGRWRVFFSFEGGKIYVLEVRRRDERTYR